MNIGMLILLLLMLAIGCIGGKHVSTPTPETPPLATVTPIPTPTPTPTSTPVPAINYGQRYRVKVLEVVDGDTIDVLFNGREERVRMLGVDTPETSAERNKPSEYDGITDLECLEYWGLRQRSSQDRGLKGDMLTSNSTSLQG